jgi:hypothetical protein
MTRLFDGMTGIAASVLGAPVIYRPQAGDPFTVQSILRRTPVRAVGPDGHDVLITAPSWRVRRGLVPNLTRGDIVEEGGETFAVLNIWPQGSPAQDAHILCELDRVPAT